jgi:hypothetical protein
MLQTRRLLLLFFVNPPDYLSFSVFYPCLRLSSSLPSFLRFILSFITVLVPSSLLYCLLPSTTHTTISKLTRAGLLTEKWKTQAKAQTPISSESP